MFIQAAKVLTRNLNTLNQIPQFIGYGMPRKRPEINHVSYADDMIIFSSVDLFSLRLIMVVLRKYEIKLRIEN